MLYIFLRKKRYIIMKISTKGRYAMRLMLDLALNNTGAPISLKDVARRQEISDKYLEQIISVLNRAGYVRSVRGAQGGYLLRKAPEEYTVGMILREDCVTLILWKKINDAICSVVDHITLQDLVDWQREKNGDYVI